MHIGAPCCGMNAAVRYSTFFIWRGGKIVLLKNLFPDHSPAIAFTLGTTLLASTMGLTGWSRFYCLIFLHVLILVLYLCVYSCTHPSLTRRKVGPSYFYPIYNFSVYHLCIISPGGVCVQSCNKCKHYLLGWGETHRMVWRQWMGGWGSIIYNECYVFKISSILRTNQH